jgi:hypothetical protein
VHCQHQHTTAEKKIEEEKNKELTQMTKNQKKPEPGHLK